jgi:hypothetical protein
MTIEELDKYIDHELQWLRYYANSDTRKELTESSNLYKDLASIGYAKRVMPLFYRCTPCSITSVTNTPICESSSLEDLISTSQSRNENSFSPLEVYWILYPEKRKWVIERLNT